MKSITETTGFIADFAMPSRQLSLTAVLGTALSGHAGVCVESGEFTTTGIGIGTRGTTGWSGTNSRSPLMVAPAAETANGSGVPAESVPALDRGKRMAEHAEATRRLYGASGECPRRVPA